MKDLTPQFDFDDLLIVPKVHTDITSRYKKIQLPERLPLFTAPMDTVVNRDNMRTFIQNKINVCLPRTIKYHDFLAREILLGQTKDDGIFISMGFQDIEDEKRWHDFQNFHEGAHILIDVANGHMEIIAEYAKYIKMHRPDIIIMVGNIANPDTYLWYAESGCVDYIRVGIGNGGGCLTTKQSGVGYPMASLIRAIRQIKDEYETSRYGGRLIAPAIIADGGMKDYVDVIKALALGADYVMIGSMFNKAFESCADNYLYGIKLNQKVAKYFFDKGYPIKKYFRGMSTKEAQKAMGKTKFKTSEGVVRYRKVEYYLQGWVENFEHYLRNAMSYSDAKTLEDFIGKADFCWITKNGYDRFNK